MKLSLAAAALAATVTLAGTAQAQTAWEANHPWRTKDNARLSDQNRRITAGVRDGELSRGQAQALRADDRAIRAEERADAALHGSHLTAGEQRQIQAQENANSRAIFAGRHGF